MDYQPSPGTTFLGLKKRIYDVTGFGILCGSGVLSCCPYGTYLITTYFKFKTAAFGSLGEHPKYHRGVGSGCYLFLDVLDTKSK